MYSCREHVEQLAHMHFCVAFDIIHLHIISSCHFGEYNVKQLPLWNETDMAIVVKIFITLDCSKAPSQSTHNILFPYLGVLL